jgi:hypothetical protein
LAWWVGSVQVPSFEMRLQGELIASQRQHIDVLVGTRLGAEKQV